MYVFPTFGINKVKSNICMEMIQQRQIHPIFDLEQLYRKIELNKHNFCKVIYSYVFLVYRIYRGYKS